MLKLNKHCQITSSLSCYNIINSNGDYIQELIPDDEIGSLIVSLPATLTNEKPTGIKYPKSEMNNFYKTI